MLIYGMRENRQPHVYRVNWFIQYFTPFFGVQWGFGVPFRIWTTRVSANKAETINPTALKVFLFGSWNRINWKLWGDRYKLSRVKVDRIPRHVYTRKSIWKVAL